MITNSIALATSLLVAIVLFLPRLRQSVQWRATVTPLASIIGSGFLIIAPLLHSVMGKWALLGIILLSILAYTLGSVIRFNIRHAEPELARNPHGSIATLEKASQWALGAAYAISVAFYISLFAAFVFDRLAIADTTLIKLFTSGLLVIIMLVAWLRGARGLETIELFAVTIKLAIIVGVLVALATYDIQVQSAWFKHEAIQSLSHFETLSMLAGMLMVTQGFETTRFMGSNYNAEQRIKAGRYAQWIAIFLYAVFIGLTCPIFLDFPITELNETTISYTLGQAIWVLPILLLVAATASQLSAALADTIGGGGLLKELFHLPISPQFYYVLVIAIAGILVWSSNVFEIINLASKGFALYYLIQTLIAFKLVLLRPKEQRFKSLQLLGLCAIVVSLSFVIGWSIPAQHS
ncbi:hypothetical protein ACFOEW_16835 [Alteromonas oceani]|uniref:Amino acid permease n=1 Tax=Alteromonas oceani TaxID=2071609 RepID=A0ABV7K2B5_9ALTE|nr:hypothetical protein [Alteromonas oceani]